MQPSPQTLAEHAAFVRSLARVLVADPHGADDVAQETWLAALERPPRHGANPRAWLARLVERLAWRRGRSASRSARREREVARPERLEGPDEGLARSEILRRVTDAVLALEEPYRSTVLLRYYEGLEASEISRRTGAPVATVRSRLQRALSQLRERLDREHGGDRETWCEVLVVAAGLVSPDGPRLPPGRQAVDASAAPGAGTGAATMGGTAKAAALVAAAAIVGILGWNVLRDDARSVADGARAEQQALIAPDQPPAVAPAGVLASGTSAHAPRVVAEGVGGAGASGLAALDVRVRWARDQRPAAGEELRLFAESYPVGNRVRPGRTDAEGRARFEDLQPGHVQVSSAHGADATAYIRPGETTTVELEVPLGFTVRGRVVDPDGEPVGGARLWLSNFFEFEPWKGSVIGTSGPDGSFELVDVPPLRELGAFAEGYAPSYMHRLPQGSVTSDVELELKLGGIGGALGIRVTTSEGAPVSDTLVQVEGPLPEGRRVGNQYLYMLPTFVGWSDERGMVALDGLPTGLAEVMAWASGMEVWKGNVTIETNGTASLAVVLRSEGVVMGTVLREDGTPVVGAKVLVEGESGSLQPSAIADDAGRYELRGLSAGDLVLRAEAEDQGSASATVRLESGAAATWDARLSIGRVVHGRVLDDTGAPIPNWSVTARSLIWESDWAELEFTGADGEFRFADVPREPVAIELYRDLLEPIATLTRRIVETEDELLLRVDRSALCDAGFVGRFRDAHGAPIERARVTFWPAGASEGPSRGLPSPSTESDASGSFRLERMPPGAYDLTADLSDGTTPFLGRFELDAEEVLDLGTIAFDEPGYLRITVTGRSPAESEAFEAFAFQQLDTEGNARWAGHVERGAAGEPVPLHAGRYRLQANATTGFANESVWFDVRAGEEVSLDLTPHRGRPVTVGGELAPGSAFPERVRTVVRDAAGEVVQECVTCEPVGRRYPHLLQLVPGTYELEVEGSDGRRAFSSFEVDLADTEPLEVYLLLR